MAGAGNADERLLGRGAGFIKGLGIAQRNDPVPLPVDYQGRDRNGPDLVQVAEAVRVLERVRQLKKADPLDQAESIGQTAFDDQPGASTARPGGDFQRRGAAERSSHDVERPPASISFSARTAGARS